MLSLIPLGCKTTRALVGIAPRHECKLSLFFHPLNTYSIMKYLSYIFLIIGSILMIYTLYIMFYPAGHTDKQFIMSLFSGIATTFLGFTLETHSTNAYTRFQRDDKRKKLRSSYTVLILSSFLVLISLIWL